MIAVELFAVSFDSSPLGTDSLSSNLAEECLPQIRKKGSANVHEYCN